MDIESKIGKLQCNDEVVYHFLGDFNNFRSLIPAGKVTDWSSDADHCHFRLEGVGETGLRIIERQPHKMVKITTEDGSSMHFLLWIQLKQVAENDTRMRIILRAELSPMLAMVVKGPLQSFADKLVDQICAYPFRQTS